MLGRKTPENPLPRTRAIGGILVVRLLKNGSIIPETTKLSTAAKALRVLVAAFPRRDSGCNCSQKKGLQNKNR